MISFNGNSILVVESDVAYAVQLKQMLSDRGAIVALSHTVDDAKKCLNRSDFDMIISTHKFADGSARDLFTWCKDSLSNVPVLAAIGNCTQFEKKQLEKLGVESFFSKSDSVKLFEEISIALFDIDEFKKNYLESRFEKGISYELKVGNKKISVKALEIMDKGVFLSFETPFTFGHEASLELKCPEGLDITALIVTGMLQGEFAGGQFFKVNDEYTAKWEKFLTELNRKQGEVSEFLRKASGK